jgi:hypothetical protein
LYNDNLLLTLNDSAWTIYTRENREDASSAYTKKSNKGVDVTSPVVDQPTEVVSENADLNKRIDGLTDAFMFNG